MVSIFYLQHPQQLSDKFYKLSLVVLLRSSPTYLAVIYLVASALNLLRKGYSD